MILIKLTINDVNHRISTDQLRLTHPWHKRVLSCDDITWKPAKSYGGQAKLSFGGFSLDPRLFADDWFPPASCPFELLLTNTTEEDAVAVLEGTAYLVAAGEAEIEYEFRGPDSEVLCPDDHSFNSTLEDVVTWACSSEYLALPVDFSAARAVSPDIIYTAGSKENMFDLLSKMCMFYCHFFFVRSGTLYLVDLLQNNGQMALNEHQFTPPKYTRKVPLARVTADLDGTEYVATSEYSNGNKETVKPFHTSSTVIESALNDILSLSNSLNMELGIPLDAELPVPGQRITTVNDSMHISTEAWIRAATFQYVVQPDREELVVSGHGGIVQ